MSISISLPLCYAGVALFYLMTAPASSIAQTPNTKGNSPVLSNEVGSDEVSISVDNAEEAKIKRPVNRYKPVMMSETTHDWIRRAIKSFETKIPVATLMPDVFPSNNDGETITQDIEKVMNIEPVIVEKKSPVLSSLIEEARPPAKVPEIITFHSFVRLGADAWVAWLNDRKISHRHKDAAFSDGAIHVKKMRDERLFFVWEASQIERLNIHWKRGLVRIASSDFYTNGRNIIIDSHTGNIGFFLSPGESFNGSRILVYAGDEPPLDGANTKDEALGGASMQDMPAEAMTAVAAQTLRENIRSDKELYLSGDELSFEVSGVQTASANIVADIPAVKKAVIPERVPTYLNKKDRAHLMTLYAILTR